MCNSLVEGRLGTVYVLPSDIPSPLEDLPQLLRLGYLAKAHNQDTSKDIGLNIGVQMCNFRCV